MRSHRVLVVAPGDWQDGRPRVFPFVETQIASLREAGWDVRIGLVDDRTSPTGVARNIRRILGEARAFDPAVVHAQYGTVTAGVAAIVAGRRPLVVSFGGDDLLGTPVPGLLRSARSRLARDIGLAAARRARAIVVKSRNLLDALPPELRARAHVVPNGVDTRFFAPAPRAEARRALGWGDEPVVLFNGSAGDNVNVKNRPLAEAAVAALVARGIAARLEVVGKLSRAEVRDRMNASDALILTSLHEGSPNVVKEAMACDLPVVSVPCGDVAERLAGVRPGGVAPYDAEALAALLAEAIAGGRSNGRAALEAQGLSASAVAARIGALYEQIG
jgi:teichuronic acid biosynthesis glycosyltransferase TuaC